MGTTAAPQPKQVGCPEQWLDRPKQAEYGLPVEGGQRGRCHDAGEGGSSLRR
jgi:hypothetical protein